MGGAVQAVSNAAQATVNTVKDAVQTVVSQPLKGVAKVAELPLAVTVDQAKAVAPAAAGLPVVGKLAAEVGAGAGAASNALDSIESGQLPSTKDLSQIVSAGGSIAGSGLTDGIFSGGGDTGFDFSSFLSGMNPPAATQPVRTITLHSPAPASAIVPGASAPSFDITSVAILGGLALVGYLAWKGM
jgi:hypothetical protein